MDPFWSILYFAHVCPFCFVSHGQEEVPSQFEAEPAARHTRRDFEQVWHYALIEAKESLLSYDLRNRVPH